MNPGEVFVVFRGTKVSAKTSAQETHAQLRTSLSSVKRELSSMGGGGGGSMIRMGQSCFQAVF